MATLDYVGQSTQAVDVAYDGFPANAEIVWVSEFHGPLTQFPYPVPQGGSGKVSIDLDAALTPGHQYSLLGWTVGGHDFIAETVSFVLYDPNATGDGL